MFPEIEGLLNNDGRRSLSVMPAQMVDDALVVADDFPAVARPEGDEIRDRLKRLDRGRHEELQQVVMCCVDENTMEANVGGAELDIRQLDVFPYGCGHVCRDECMALSLIAALQDNDLGAALLAARHLSGHLEGDAPLTLTVAGQGYADALLGAGQKLMSVPASVIHSIAAFGSGPSPASESIH